MIQDTDGSLRPKMPDRSGIDVPSRAGRLTDSYFLLKDEWIPQMVTDTTLPQQILNGGRTLKNQGKDWGLREECFISLLFETGARVSELMALTFGDWKRRGLKDSAWARNKGSRKRRAKFVCFSEDTVKLLKRYINTERVTIDPHHWTLDDYLAHSEQREVDLDEVPIFLSKRSTPWTVAAFRAHYWKKACAASKIDVDPHQARHWYVSQALVRIHAQARAGKATVEQGVAELIAYMAWRSGERVMQAYNHFYNATNHAAVQKDIFQLLRASSKQKPQCTVQRPAPQETFSSMPAEKPQAMPRKEQQLEKQNAVYAFLIGTGGYRDDLIELLTAE
ncbi:MAG TPA: site-specific integrase [Ktedonobacteraceae bacterium]|nr:site-specific integrase [Ktedonobacteraceae bacterium]